MEFSKLSSLLLFTSLPLSSTSIEEAIKSQVGKTTMYVGFLGDSWILGGGGRGGSGQEAESCVVRILCHDARAISIPDSSGQAPGCG